MSDAKDDLHRYLRQGRDVLLWKLDGLSEYDVRRPVTPTGTNLLGLVKHVASVGLGYFGFVFDRPSPDDDLPWLQDEAPDNADMWATAEESRQDVLDFWHRAWAHADATIEALDLDVVGHVPWWGDDGAVTLHRVLVHMVAELHRHVGHADIVRELVDGAVGLRDGVANIPRHDEAWWADYRAQLEDAATRGRS